TRTGEVQFTVADGDGAGARSANGTFYQRPDGTWQEITAPVDLASGTKIRLGPNSTFVLPGGEVEGSAMGTAWRLSRSPQQLLTESLGQNTHATIQTANGMRISIYGGAASHSPEVMNLRNAFRNLPPSQALNDIREIHIVNDIGQFASGDPIRALP